MQKKIFFGCIFLLSGCALDDERVASREQEGRIYSEATGRQQVGTGEAKSSGRRGGFFKTLPDAIPSGQNSRKYGKHSGDGGKKHWQERPHPLQSHQDRPGHQDKHHQQPNCSGDARPANRDGRIVCVPKK